MKKILILISLMISPLLGDETAPWFGVATHEHFQENQDLPGVVIAFIWADSPAAKSGLLEDDVIISVNDEKILSPEHLANILMKKKAGTKVTVSYQRKGQPGTTKATLESLAKAEERGAFVIEDFENDFPIKKPSEITPQHAKRTWIMIENDTKFFLLGMGFSPEHVARVIEKMKPAGQELTKIPPKK